MPPGHTIVHDRHPSFRSICWTLRSPTTTRRVIYPPVPTQDMDDAPDQVGKGV